MRIPKGYVAVSPPFPYNEYPNLWFVSQQMGFTYRGYPGRWTREGAKACPTQERIITAHVRGQINIQQYSDHVRAWVNAKGERNNWFVVADHVREELSRVGPADTPA